MSEFQGFSRNLVDFRAESPRHRRGHSARTGWIVGLRCRARLPEKRRPPVTLIVDELQTMPGADYEAILSEVSKYGANLVLTDIESGRIMWTSKVTTAASRDVNAQIDKLAQSGVEAAQKAGML